ncbi:Histone-lysine N-methyltransferase [Aphelenchoides fujianensis]|nr:Histone-lysine N-methyltransferase [Aphelenchoides fujianensis]
MPRAKKPPTTTPPAPAPTRVSKRLRGEAPLVVAEAKKPKLEKPATPSKPKATTPPPALEPQRSEKPAEVVEQPTEAADSSLEAGEPPELQLEAPEPAVELDVPADPEQPTEQEEAVEQSAEQSEEPDESKEAIGLPEEPKGRPEEPAEEREEAPEEEEERKPVVQLKPVVFRETIHCFLGKKPKIEPRDEPKEEPRDEEQPSSARPPLEIHEPLDRTEPIERKEAEPRQPRQLRRAKQPEEAEVVELVAESPESLEKRAADGTFEHSAEVRQSLRENPIGPLADFVQPPHLRTDAPFASAPSTPSSRSERTFEANEEEETKAEQPPLVNVPPKRRNKRKSSLNADPPSRPPSPPLVEMTPVSIHAVEMNNGKVAADSTIRGAEEIDGGEKAEEKSDGDSKDGLLPRGSLLGGGPGTPGESPAYELADEAPEATNGVPNGTAAAVVSAAPKLLNGTAAIPSCVEPTDDATRPPFKRIKSCIVRCEEAYLRVDIKPRCECWQNEVEEPCSEKSNCLNRAMSVECYNCRADKDCQNRRFQNHEHARTEVKPSGMKGLGLFACEDIKPGKLIIEYVGEIIDRDHCDRRSRRYARNPAHKHHYLMTLTNGLFIDATKLGNDARYINHSCEPNAKTEKWTINKRPLRFRNDDGKFEKRITSTCIGFFATKDIRAGEEIVFDYKFERFGKRAQKCYCGAPTCRGFISSNADDNEMIEDDGTRDDVSTDTSDEDDTTDEEEDDEEREQRERERNDATADSKASTRPSPSSSASAASKAAEIRRKQRERNEKPDRDKKLIKSIKSKAHRSVAQKFHKHRANVKPTAAAAPATPTTPQDEHKKQQWSTTFRIPKKTPADPSASTATGTSASAAASTATSTETPARRTASTERRLRDVKQEPIDAEPTSSKPAAAARANGEAAATEKSPAQGARPQRRSRFTDIIRPETVKPPGLISLPDVSRPPPAVGVQKILSISPSTPTPTASCAGAVPTVDLTTMNPGQEPWKAHTPPVQRPPPPKPYHVYAGTIGATPFNVPPPPPPPMTMGVAPPAYGSALTGLQYWSAALPPVEVPSASDSTASLKNWLGLPPPPPPAVAAAASSSAFASRPRVSSSSAKPPTLPPLICGGTPTTDDGSPSSQHGGDASQPASVTSAHANDENDRSGGATALTPAQMRPLIRVWMDDILQRKPAELEADEARTAEVERLVRLLVNEQQQTKS